MENTEQEFSSKQIQTLTEVVTNSVKAEVTQFLSNLDSLVILSFQNKDVIESIKPILLDTFEKSIQVKIDEVKQEVDKSVKLLKNQLERAESKIDDMEAYDRRNNLVFTGLPDSTMKSTDELVIDLCKNKLNVDVSINDIQRSLRLGRIDSASDTTSKPRPIIVRFVSYRVRQDIYQARKSLRQRRECVDIYVNENLTVKKMGLLREVKSMKFFKSVYTRDGRVFAWFNDRHYHISSSDTLGELIKSLQ